MSTFRIVVQKADNERRPRVFSCMTTQDTLWGTGNQIIIRNKSSHHVSTPVLVAIRPVLKYLVQSCNCETILSAQFNDEKLELWEDLAYSFTASKKRSQNVNAGQSNNSSSQDRAKSDRTHCLEDMWQDLFPVLGAPPSCVGLISGNQCWGWEICMLEISREMTAVNTLFDFHDFWVREGERRKSAWKHSLCPQWQAIYLPTYLKL